MALPPNHKRKDNEIWIGVEGTWYDITHFEHPGGQAIIDEFANQDATVPYLAMHPRTFLQQRLAVRGTYETTTDPLTRTWMTLNDKFQQDGRYDSCVGFLYSRVGILLGLATTLFLGIALYRSTTTTTSPFVQWTCMIVSSVCLAFFWQQSGFLMHDTQHMHIFQSLKKDHRLAFLFTTLFFGVAFEQDGRDQAHIEHHFFTNTMDSKLGPTDPQSTEIAWIPNPVLIPYAFQPAVTLMLKFQKYYFIPLICIVGTIPFKLKSFCDAQRWVDLLGLLLNVAWITAVVGCYPTWYEGWLFFVMANSVAGFLGLQLFVSHYSKPFFDKNDCKRGWVQHQIVTCVDIDSPEWLDWFHGGLNLHSVHHLFPRMCRVHYREVYEDIIAMCNTHNVYLEQRGFFEAIGMTVQHLGTVGNKVKKV